MRPETDTDTTTASEYRGQGDAPASDPTKAVNDLHFDLLHSAFYHDMRAAYFSTLYRLSLFIVVVLGSAAVTALANPLPWLAQLAGMAIAAISAAHLVFDWAGTHRSHVELKRKFYDLLADLEGGHDLRAIRARQTLLWAEEPPENKRTADRAHNRAGRSLYGEDFKKVGGKPGNRNRVSLS